MTKGEIQELKEQTEEYIKDPPYDFYDDNPEAAVEEVLDLHKIILNLIEEIEKK